MNRTGQEIKTLRKKAKSWLSSLSYYSARGEVSLDTFAKRLHSLFQPVLKPDILKGAIKVVVPERMETKEATRIKKRIMSRLTPDKVYRRMLCYSQIYSSKALVKDKPDSMTLGRLLIAWAVLTDQSPQDFLTRVSSKVTRLYMEWCASTSCFGLSDEECFSHLKESAKFWSGIWQTLIQATPEDKLVHLIRTGIKALGAVIEMPGLEKELYELFGQASRLVTSDAAEKIELALKVNPSAGERISIPELKALVLREEAKLGWNNNNKNEVLSTLWRSLSPDLEIEDNADESIRSSMEAIGKRSLFNNLLDALNGRLRMRFVESIKHFLSSTVRVKSNWHFDTSNLIVIAVAVKPASLV